jgi:SAM-dependent methyltransferase
VRVRRLRVRVRLRRRRAVTADDPPDLPAPKLLARQAERLAGVRARLLRRVGIAHRGPVLDLGAGYGSVTGELGRRSRGPAIALDRRVAPLRRIDTAAVAGDGAALPFRDGAFDLVFAQLVFLWITRLDAAVAEVARVLRPGGVLVAIEPDYGGAIEHPPAIATAALWEQGLARAGADPRVGRRLVVALRARGFEVAAELSAALPPVDDDRLTLLAGLVGEEAVAPLRAAERAVAAEQAIAYVPHFLLTARRR